MADKVTDAVLTKANRDCLAKAMPGEPMFIILGRDPDGANIVRLWAQRRLEAGGDPSHALPVFGIANAMDAWRAEGHRPESAPDASKYPAMHEAKPDGDAVEAVRQRLRDNLASAPADAEKCFVSLDDHRTVVAALASPPPVKDEVIERMKP